MPKNLLELHSEEGENLEYNRRNNLNTKHSSHKRTGEWGITDMTHAKIYSSIFEESFCFK